MNAPIPFFTLFFWNNGNVSKQTLSYELLINHIRLIQEGGLTELDFFTTIMPDGSWVRVYVGVDRVTLEQYGQSATLDYLNPSTWETSVAVYHSAELLEAEYVGATD